MTFKCARLSGSPGIVKAAFNAPALKQGAEGEAVRVLQMAFIDLGFAMPGSTKKNAALPDGIFGPETARVTAAFQRANHLVPDGVAGAMTLARLDQLLDARSGLTVRLDKARGNKGTGRD
jgi:peptidoglycan hydrolase-like protein with peptidoglycan-binding domain